MALLSLVPAGAGLVLYYTLEELDRPLFVFCGLRLADAWLASGLLVLAGVGELGLCGPPRKGQIASLARFMGWATWAVAQALAATWLVAAAVSSRHLLGSAEAWGRAAAWASVGAVALGAVTSDFRALPWVQRHRTVSLNFTALLIGLAAAAVVAELAMRHIFRPPVFSPLFAKSPIPACGFEMKPDFDGQLGNVHVRLNSEGFRSPEISPQKTCKRILTIGDSVTFGAWVEQGKTYPAILQQLLPAGRYEVINAGVPAYDLEQIIALFKQKGVRYQPNIVIYTFVYDDIADPLALGESGALVQEPGRRYGAKVAMPDRYRLFPLPRWLVHRSRLLTAVVMRYYRFRESRHISGERDLLDDLLAERWGWLEERLIELLGSVEKAGARFLLVIFPVGLSEHSIQRLMAVARKNGIEAMELRTALGDSRTYAARYMTPWDAHPNADAHALMARAICDRLVVAHFVEPAGGAIHELPAENVQDRSVPPTERLP